MTADDSGAIGAAVSAAARQAGQASVSDNSVIDALCGCGYEPTRTANDDIELRNCPFHQLACVYPELICDFNLQLIQGMLEAAGDQPERAVLVPPEGRCCVMVRAAAHPDKKPFHRRANASEQPTKDSDE